MPIPPRLSGLILLLALGACVAEPEAPTRPSPRFTQPVPATGTVVVQPQP